MAATAVTLALLLALAGGPWAVLGGPLGSHSLLDREAGAADVGVSAAALDMARLRPVKKWFAGHNIYYQNALDGKAKGLLIMFHKCGRSGSDFWPRSDACEECEGLPMGLAKTKQALLRGYAVASMSSQDRTSGPGARCFAWSADASAAVQLIRWLPKELGLPPGAPVYLNGASSGGSMALRLPLEVAVDGLVGEVIAPGDYGRILDDVKARGRAMPPALYIHMPLDEGMRPKVEENISELRKRNLAVGEIQAMPLPVGRLYFSDCSPLIAPALSARIYAALKKGGFLDAKDLISQDLKNSEWGAFREWMNKDMRAALPHAAGQTVASVPLLSAHIMECLGVAWARHETVGEYMAAALAWLESGGAADAGQLAQRLRVKRMSSLLLDGR